MAGTGTTDLLPIARVLKSNGTDGGLLVSLHEISPEEIDLQEPVFIEFDGLPVPFFIRDIVPHGSRALVHLTDILTLDDAEEVVGRDILVDADAYCLEEDPSETLLGWTLEDASGRVRGMISDYEPIPGNPCLHVTLPDGTSAMVPLHEDLVIGMDSEEGVLRMNLPDGLL